MASNYFWATVNGATVKKLPKYVFFIALNPNTSCFEIGVASIKSIHLQQITPIVLV